MPTQVFQRYLLNAVSASTPIGATGAGQVNVFSATVPLSGQWTIRLRRITGFASPQDGSGKLVLNGMRCAWLLETAAGTIIFDLEAGVQSWVTPGYSFPALTNFAVSASYDTYQTVSSVDQVGAVIANVQAFVTLGISNPDAAAHNVTAQVSAVLEFEREGASE